VTTKGQGTLNSFVIAELPQRVDSGGSISVLRATGIGAFEPVPDAPAKVSSPNRQRSLGPGRGNRRQFQLSPVFVECTTYAL